MAEDDSGIYTRLKFQSGQRRLAAIEIKVNQLLKSDKENRLKSPWDSFDDTVIVLDAKCALKYLDEYGNFRENLLHEALRFVKQFNSNLIQLIKKHALECNFDETTGADETQTLAFNILVKALIGPGSFNMEIFVHLHDYIKQPGQGLTEDETTYFDLFEGISNVASEWLLRHNFIDKDVTINPAINPAPIRLKIVLIGNVGVGKTSLIQTYNNPHMNFIKPGL